VCVCVYVSEGAPEGVEEARRARRAGGHDRLRTVSRLRGT